MGKDNRHNKRQDPYRHIRRPTPPPPIFHVSEKEKIKRAKGPKLKEILNTLDSVESSEICELCNKNPQAPASLLCYECMNVDIK